MSVDRLEKDVLPASNAILAEAKRLFPSELSFLDYLGEIRNYNDVARNYLDAVVRLRRAMLDLNTVVGRRILP